jgi:hypothetical protein
LKVWVYMVLRVFAAVVLASFVLSVLWWRFCRK